MAQLSDVLTGAFFLPLLGWEITRAILMKGKGSESLWERCRKNKIKISRERVRNRAWKFSWLLSRENIMERNWNNLIILDACRADTFERCNKLEGKLLKVISMGSHTSEWFVNTFKGLKLPDVVYVSGNPLVSYEIQKTLGYSPFARTVNVWDFGFDEKLGTVHPKTINEAALVSLRVHRQKRHIFHYMQPHQPFIGKISIKPEDGWSRARDRCLGLERKKKYRDVFDMLKDGEISVIEGKQAYESNLKLVLKYVEELLHELEGKTAITSDHGNLFGAYGYYAHPENVYCPQLVQVPYFEVKHR